ncbi:hypothetical protein PB01_20105 [Psychrobacillus glaciei]|uniref:Uncharacterized protein n=1 Tax=Psychrobacillus glaciei TaxID=2283160 RepID=A0A5J6STN3_9BACI|nr:hypothetical protein [Psychrobacillus glaciei]QFG00910.1 hypothetical protein PB01_20105 [Psychrobacillus glaciei]
MLKRIDEFYMYIMIALLVVYLINFAYFGELTITFTVIALSIILEIIIHRHHMKRHTNAQLSIIGVVLLAGIAGIIYLFVLFRIFLDPFSLSSTLEHVLLLAFVLVCLYALIRFIKNLFGRAIENK